MRKSLLLILVVFTIINIKAQKVSGGMYFSPILSWEKTDEKKVESAGNRFSYGYGIFVYYNFTDNFSLASGINVNEVGGRLKYTEGLIYEYEDQLDTLPDGVRIKSKIRYVELPISLIGKTNEIGYMKYYMKAGISPMFRWKAKADIDTQDEITDVNIKDEINIFNLAFHVGAGFEYSLGGNTALITELTFYNGLTDITHDDSDKFNTYSVLTHQFMLKVGVKF
jgi:opacity protein-like surface antigen